MAEKFYMTSEAKEKAEERLKYLTTVKRQEIIERIQEARSHGDLSENAEYDAARNEQATNEGEILELSYQLKNAEVIEENFDTTVVHIGSTVTVLDPEFGETETYTIRGTTEADPMHNIISNESPVGRALIGHRKGETVKVATPDGQSYELAIRDIK